MQSILTPTPANADCPLIQANTTLQSHRLTLNFQIHHKSPYDWAVFDDKNIKHTDFLWEQDCFECFVQIDNKAYFEINASPTGAFALYHFDDYRTPNTMPPRATKELSFEWQNIQLNQPTHFLGSGNTPENATFFQSEFCYLVNLPNLLTVYKINPTAILYQNGEPIYYASKHASPPDFHNKAYWQSL